MDKDNPQYDEGTDLAYDFNTLAEEGFIVIRYLSAGQDSYGAEIAGDPVVKVTLDGFAALREWKAD